MVRSRHHLVSYLILLPLLLTSCNVEPSASTPTPTMVVEGSFVPEPVKEPTATIANTPEPTRSPSLDALLAPGPTFPPPSGVFFEFGDDIWYQPDSETARPVVEDQRHGPWAVTADGNQIAVVRYRVENDQAVEEIIVFNNDGSNGEPIYGPVPTAGAAGSATVRALDWSWDHQALAAMFSNNTIGVLRFAAEDPFRTKPPLDSVDVPDAEKPLADLGWAPNGAGIAYTIRADTGMALYVTPNDDTARLVIAPSATSSRAVRAFDWLPGRGRLAFVESAGGPSSHLPGSIFTIAPDGTLLELLVSAGQFAPAATIATLSASPDGRDLAFTVHVPDGQGQQVFQSLWVMSIDGGDFQQVPVTAGYRATDLHWSTTGLIWRGIDRNSRLPTDGSAYTGDEPFILGRFDPTSGATSIAFQSELVD